MKKILFVCTGNTCRSSMAEALLKHFASANNITLQVKSAGTAAFGNQGASKNAILAVQELGIDLTKHRAQLVSEELINEADLILTMTSAHKQQLLAYMPEASYKIYTLAEFASNDAEKNISDPFGGNLQEYIECRNEITNHIRKLIQTLNSQIGDE